MLPMYFVFARRFCIILRSGYFYASVALLTYTSHWGGLLLMCTVPYLKYRGAIPYSFRTLANTG